MSLTDNLIFLTAQDSTDYFLWQDTVYTHNFIRKGIDPKSIYVLVSVRGEIPAQWLTFKEESPCNILFYPDTRQTMNYIPSLRPNAIKQFFKENPEMQSKWCFYHDSDIIFNRVPNFEQLTRTNSWKVSDTVSYIGYEYIREKGTDVLLDMCEVVGISPSVIRANQSRSGGCQYLLRNTGYDFWDKVERDCENLFTTITKNRTQYERVWQNLSLLALTKSNDKRVPDYHDLQIWCSDMWAVLWNAWLWGFSTEISSELAFSWGTSDLSTYHANPIFHNAGVTSESKVKQKLFYKGEFINKSPFGADFSYVDKNTASYQYVKLIEEVYRIERKPKVSCVMTTFGRFTCVERAIACYLEQDYPEKELIILNTAPIPLTLGPELQNKNIRIVNQTTKTGTGIKYTNVGEIRADAMAMAEGEIYVCWDDDDLWLPWFMKFGMKRLLDSGKRAWKPKFSYFTPDGGQTFQLVQNSMEASVLVHIGELHRFGFATNKGDGAEHTTWFRGLVDEEQLDENIDTSPWEYYCYVWGEEIARHKQSGNINDPNNFDNHKKASDDFGDRPLGIYDREKLFKWYRDMIKYHDNPEVNKTLESYYKFRHGSTGA